MKLKDGFLLRNIAGQHMAVPVGERSAELHGVLSLNETGAFLWQQLSREQSVESLICALTETYEVSQENARDAVEGFLAQLKIQKVLEE